MGAVSTFDGLPSFLLLGVRAAFCESDGVVREEEEAAAFAAGLKKLDIDGLQIGIHTVKLAELYNNL
jgi:hypothetical protein